MKRPAGSGARPGVAWKEPAGRTSALRATSSRSPLRRRDSAKAGSCANPLEFESSRPYNDYMGTLPNGTVTFLFTDVEGSTKLAQQYPDSASGLLERQQAILKNAIEAHGGYIFHIIGDAFCAAFHTVRQALEAALDAQRCLRAEAWSPEPIRVRMGITTGSAQTKRVEGRPPDYSGYLTLARAQRVMSVAYGGQILLGDASVALVRGELPPQVSLRDMGEHRLKSLLNPERLWQPVAPGLEADFPPLKSLNDIPNNLPLQLTSFIGREREMSDVGQLLERHRLVTLTGSGGTGKTRLALQIAADVMDEFEDGAWLVELAAVSDPGLVPQGIAAALGVHEEAGSTLLETLKGFLARQCLVLVLDNCEHMLEACGQIADALLRCAARLRIVATSREALGIAGEAIFPLPSLSLPLASVTTAEGALLFDGIRLFLERAAAIQPDFHLTDQNASAVAEICVRLDGIPLAIELAAARVKGMSVEQIAARLQDRFHLLTGGSRTALPRQRTLRATIDWSYRLLAEDERSMLRQLSVFSGGWTLEAAESVCAGRGIAAGEVLNVHLRLIDKSLVAADTQVSEPRYHMLETIRQYAQEKLDDDGEAGEARARHLRYYVGLAERAEPQFIGRESPQWLERMDEDRENLRAAIDYAVTSGQPEEALKIFGAAFWLWVWQASHSEGQELAELALAAAPVTNSVARAKTLTGLGFCAHQQSDYAAALRTWREALPIWEERNEKWWLALLKSWIANALHRQGQASIPALMIEAVQLAREDGDPWILAHCLWMLGAEWSEQGASVEGRSLLEESLALIRRIGDPILLDEVLLELACVAEAEKDYARALDLYMESREAARKMRDHIFVAYFNLELGRLLQIMGDNNQAADLFAESLREARHLVKRSSLVQGIASLGVVAHARGDPERAVRLLAAGLSLFDGMGGRQADTQLSRPWLEQHISALRAELGEERFAALYREGQAMTPEQAVQYALEEPQGAVKREAMPA